MNLNENNLKTLCRLFNTADYDKIKSIVLSFRKEADVVNYCIEQLLPLAEKRVKHKVPLNEEELVDLINRELSSYVFNSESGGTMTIGGQASMNISGAAKMKL